MFLLNLLLGLILTCSAISSVDAVTGLCSNPWVDGTLTDMGCLLFDSTKSYNWELANAYCQDKANGTLVEILTEAQHDFVLMILEFLEDHEEPKTWWTSGTDLAREGKWYWGSSLAPVGQFIWAGTEPDSGISANCMDLSTSVNPMAEDTSCGNYKYPICQRK